MTALREYRLRRGITLVKAAVYADLSLSRASEIERDPSRARPGEIEALQRAVDRLSAGLETER
jgi:transcriptional regulator with XRE-family HTH domain